MSAGHASASASASAGAQRRVVTLGRRQRNVVETTAAAGDVRQELLGRRVNLKVEEVARPEIQAQLIAELIASNAAVESAASLDDEAPAPFGCGGLVRRGVSARAGTRARRS
mgnify:CR=1 FL=1